MVLAGTPVNKIGQCENRSHTFHRIEMGMGLLPFPYLDWLKIKEQTRKLATDGSKHYFEVANKTDQVSSKHWFEVVDRTDQVSNRYLGQGDADLV